MRKFLKACVCGLAVASVITGCSGKEAKETESTTAVESSAVADSTAESTAAELETMEVKDLSEFDNGTITLGEYKGIEVTKRPVEVSDEEVEAAILQDRESKTEYVDVDRAVQDTDKVNIDYVGTKDDVAFEGGTAEKQDLVIGSNSYIDGFESGLIGAKKGDEVTLNLTFPENYGNADLAGQDVVFKVTVNNVQEQKMPELDDAFVQEISEYKTVDEYKAGKKEMLQANKEAQANNQLESDLVQAVVENSQIETNQEAVDANYDNLIAQANNQAVAYGVDLNVLTYVSYGMDEASFREYMKVVAEAAVEQRLAFNAIAEKEGITVSDEDRENLASETGYESKEQMAEMQGSYTIDDYLLSHKVVDFIKENAVIK